MDKGVLIQEVLERGDLKAQLFHRYTSILFSGENYLFIKTTPSVCSVRCRDSINVSIHLPPSPHFLVSIIEPISNILRIPHFIILLIQSIIAHPK